MAQSYKTLKEDFVSNLSGGSVLEVNYVTAVAPVRIHLGICCISVLIAVHLVSLSLVVSTPVAPGILRHL